MPFLVQFQLHSEYSINPIYNFFLEKKAKSKIEKVGGKITAKKLVNIKNDKKNTNEKTLNGE